MKKVLISGGSGLVGSALSKKLIERGYTVNILSRSPGEKDGIKAFEWDIEKAEIDMHAYKGVTAIIHLAGAGIADKRWTDKRKEIIIDSRVESARLLYLGAVKAGIKLSAFVSASGINYYGSKTTDHIFVETDPPSSEFIGDCCVQWEAAADEFKDLTRVVKLRTGVVLSKKGGALDRMAQPVKLGVGAPLGTGKQYIPYIHIDDLCEMYIYAIENEHVEGAYNACNGDYVNNVELTEALARELNKPLWMPHVPEFALKLLFGEMAQIILYGSRASADKIKSTGFEFNFQNMNQTLFDIYE
ncbi:TIGR01777 family protein [Cryomorpha ignava]|uniref:TIGR01777 family protein n=1 Tax=Cryomorpha ignava TaxID=101383 RepID=A0A7K3WJT8_9FLAO|nr:TIGR01777 family oxidoreductase [Cryomorpha ignava]NEN21907.1 TIGR01777 family protein [Cryomorpha ignava]